MRKILIMTAILALGACDTPDTRERMCGPDDKVYVNDRGIWIKLSDYGTTIDCVQDIPGASQHMKRSRQKPEPTPTATGAE